MAKIKTATTKIAREIQIGDNTQIQGHVIYPVSLRAMNNRVNHPENPIEAAEDEDCILLLVILLMVFSK